MGIRGGVFHLTSPGISFRLPPWGATAHRESPGFNARPMAGQKYHCPTLRIIALPGAARQFQNILLAPSPLGRSWRDFWIGFGSSPRSGNGLDEVRIRLSRFRERPSGGEALRKSPSTYKPRERRLFPCFLRFFKKFFQQPVNLVQPLGDGRPLHPLCLSDFRLLFL